LVDDEPFDVRYGQLVSHERSLDMRAGTLTRQVRWRSPTGREVRIRSVRLVSLTHRSIAAISYEVEAVDDTRVVVQSELVANESLPGRDRDPRAAADIGPSLVGEETLTHRCGAVMVHTTRLSGLRLAAGMDHDLEQPGHAVVDVDAQGDIARVTLAARLRPGERLRMVKLVAYGWSARRSRSALHDQVVAALAGARESGWDGLVDDQREFLDEFWSGADVEVDGDAQVQQAVRFALFQMIQAAARAEQRPIPAKGLTGPGYDGHTFWDSEIYVLPVLTYTHPAAAADALRWRASTLAVAEDNATGLGLEGAAFAWRTISGAECSGYWPAGTAAFHVNADIADAAIRYVEATGDVEFEKDTSMPLLVATARLWRSLGQHDMEGNFRIDGVTGPDEYSAIADNNVYTNLMAAQNLVGAAEVAGRYRAQAAGLGVTAEEMASWRDAAHAIVIPYDERLGIHPQSERFTDHARWEFESTGPEKYPLLLHFPYFNLYRKQVVKQADLVLAMQLRGEAFTPEQKARNFDYYEELTVRDSSLSAGTQAVMAAEVGHMDLAHDYLAEAALMDLQDLENNTRDGLHLASLAGTWHALVMGFGGLRTEKGVLSFSPRLPESITGLCFKLRYRGRRLEVAIDADHAAYRLLEGEAVSVLHHGTSVRLDPGQEASRRLPRIRSRPRPQQPKHREPPPHHPGEGA
ncbi:MAG: glycoside hydrolase family 65 protein, partial [Acidimicrobiales bacterium]|nr:glycoside hydrolase family 65 protein [Acidimicrobiales bacterium]